MEKTNSSTPKKQHYVPQFILKNFESGKKKRIHVFDKHKKQSFISSVRDAASENGFYNININGDEYTLETKIASLESSASKVIQKIINSESIANITNEEFRLLSLFCAVQILRTKHHREFVNQFQDSIAYWLTREQLSAEDLENFEMLDNKGIKKHHIECINHLAIDISNRFINKRIALVKAPHGTEFYISDNPITMHNHFPRPNRGNLGLALDGIEIHFPISNKHCITFTCPKLVEQLVNDIERYQDLKNMGVIIPFNMSNANEVIEMFENKRTMTLMPENIEFHNSLQVAHSCRFLYSSKGDFSLVEDMLRTNPECASSPRLSQ